MTPRSELIVPDTSHSPSAARPTRSRRARAFAPKFDADGLVTCVATDARSGDVLMVAHMNAEALQQTIATGEAWYFSRSRRALWSKGESSGHVQRVVEMRVDCDQDAVWIRVEQDGAGACHTGRRSCFYRAVPLGESRRGDARIPRRREDVRSRGGLRRRNSLTASAIQPRPLRPLDATARRALEMRAVVHHPVDADGALAGIGGEGGDDGPRLGDRRRRSA